MSDFDLSCCCFCCTGIFAFFTQAFQQYCFMSRRGGDGCTCCPKRGFCPKLGGMDDAGDDEWERHEAKLKAREERRIQEGGGVLVVDGQPQPAGEMSPRPRQGSTGSVPQRPLRPDELVAQQDHDRGRDDKPAQQ